MKRNNGFTIVELLIVIVVIGILAAITMVAFTNMQQRARDSRRQQVVTDLVKAINAYAIDNNGSDITVGGGGGGGTGWVNAGAEPTITTTLQTSGVVPNASGLRDPQCTATEVPGCSGLIKFRCGTRFAIAARLETGGTPALPAEMSSCANNGWWGQFGMNYYRMGG
jgi:prepilin-type N-terminal cleavage/methylation domain-containing protein